MMRSLFLILLTFVSVASTPAHAEPTEIVVRVISQDAKFVGDSMGGAEVVLRDARTGEELARGITSGGTGDTNLIMSATGRSPLRSSDTAAAFRTTVDIDAPTLVRVEISGPLGFPQTMQRATSERWLIPGQSAASGDGWVVELPGLAIRVPPASLSSLEFGTGHMLTAHVQLMCGCPITAGGLWDAAQYDVLAELRQSGEVRQRVTFAFAEEPGQFRSEWTPSVRGVADLVIIARNRVTGNTGVLSQQVMIR